MKVFKYLFFLATIVAFTLFAYALDYRVEEIPNGGVHECNYCHFPEGEGGPLTSFGKQVDRNGITNFRVDWSKLYNLDADGDGFTNGEEMGDPNGEWRIGDPDPDWDGEITKPWDENDFPTSVRFIKVNTLKVSPNPFDEIVKLEFFLEKNGDILIEVIDLIGNRIDLISHQFQASGPKSFIWDGKDSSENKVNSGIYFIKITSDKSFQTTKIILN